jgi:GntR family transcriptional regulator
VTPPPSKRLLIPPISPAGPGTLYEQIVEGLTREISEGRLAPGTPLPSFRVLAADLLVSVITVKRAYEDLEREGLVYRRQGLGTFVAEAADDKSRDAKRARAEALVREAVREATEAGLSHRDIARLIHDILHDERTTVHVRRRS